MLHPDRFHQSGQSAEWHLANEMLKELNLAYATLKDESKRAEYDRSHGQSSPRTQQPPPPRKPQPEHTSPPRKPASVKLGELAAGHATFFRLPKSVQQKLLERQSGVIKNQFRSRTGGVGWQYTGATLSAGWFIMLFNFATDIKWQSDSVFWYVVLTGVACAVGAACTAWIIRWRRSPLKCHFYVTPLYFIKTQLEQVSYWPIWELRDIKATHRYRNGAYQGTDVSMVFPNKTEQITISPESAYTWMIDALKAFDEKVRSARQQEDWSYFYEEDDFREAPDSATDHDKSRSKIVARTWATCLVVGSALFLVAYSINSAHTNPSNLAGARSPSTDELIAQAERERLAARPLTYRPTFVPDSEQQKVAAQNRKTLDDVFPEESEPANNHVFKNNLGSGNGSLTIRNGSSSHAVVKLVDTVLDTSVYTVFVRANNTVTIPRITDGSYRHALCHRPPLV